MRNAENKGQQLWVQRVLVYKGTRKKPRRCTPRVRHVRLLSERDVLSQRKCAIDGYHDERRNLEMNQETKETTTLERRHIFVLSRVTPGLSRWHRYGDYTVLALLVMANNRLKTRMRRGVWVEDATRSSKGERNPIWSWPVGGPSVKRRASSPTLGHVREWPEGAGKHISNNHSIALPL
ncbi:hypothetical protein MRX96_027579 [Rhipicephalus microplus]